ncbi:hypothetical protein EUTSA_v10026763mg [Eutrema salsugineum]|uniref:Ribosomal protein L7/L12 oligomerisation domain-containing protein n=1 Tax=Eutrema salsugineum TaxID=72664 RepID=V4LZ91_EUTSA|nr:hypothetical protein EUTSA_v10026763mg [Eutrema salsugineum]
MSLILRFRQLLSTRLAQTSRLSLVPRIGDCRSFGQPARKEDEEEEKEIDQRKLPTDYDPATFDPTEHRSPSTERVFRLVDEISSLTLPEIFELGAIIMPKKGITELPTIAVMKPGAAGAGIVSGVGQRQSGGGGGASEEAKAEKIVFETLSFYFGDLRTEVSTALSTFKQPSQTKTKKRVKSIPIRKKHVRFQQISSSDETKSSDSSEGDDSDKVTKNKESASSFTDGDVAAEEDSVEDDVEGSRDAGDHESQPHVDADDVQDDATLAQNQIASVLSDLSATAQVSSQLVVVIYADIVIHL